MGNKKLQMLVEGGLMTALSVVLGLVTMFHMPQGGSVTAASMLPIVVYALRWGGVPGIAMGALVGFFNALFGGFVVNIVQGALDYPLAFAAIGIVGFFRSDKLYQVILGSVLGTVIRYFFHILSGVIYFKEYAGLDNPWFYSIGYNSFVLADMGIALAVMVLLYLTHAKQLFARQTH